MPSLLSLGFTLAYSDQSLAIGFQVQMSIQEQCYSIVLSSLISKPGGIIMTHQVSSNESSVFSSTTVEPWVYTRNACSLMIPLYLVTML